jgi:hypothetical protein
MRTVEEIELRKQDRNGLVTEAEKERLVLWLWAAHPRGRFWRSV